MFFLRTVLSILLISLAIFLITPLFLAQDIQIQKTTAIANTPEDIFSYLAERDKLKRWEPWYIHWRQPGRHAADLDISQRKGRLSWEINAQPRRYYVVIRTHVLEPFTWEHQVKWTLSPISGGTKVEFKLAKQVEYPWGQWKLLLMKDYLEKYANASLKNLKTISEQ